MKHKLHSFDVFDTVLIRIWAKPKDLFLEVGKYLQKENLISIAPHHWANLRIEAEKNARQIFATQEITFKQIYNCLAPCLNWVSDDIEKAQQKEIELELSSLRPVPATQKKINALHQQDLRVFYISDTYLPKEIIKLSLKQNNIWADGDILYVSSAEGVRKASGLLFQHCLLKESIEPSYLHHLRDNYHSDIKVPETLGITTQRFTQTNLNRYEALISSQDQLPLKFRSLLAGSSRLTRLQCQANNTHNQVIWETAASVMAPVLLGFVNWCLQQAEKKKIKRLYFVARDGQILLKIAKVLCKNWGYQVDCRYLYGSRQALKFPAIKSIGKYELDWIFDFPKIFMSVRSVCERVNIKPEQIRESLTVNGFPEIMWERNLKARERALLKELFQQASISNLIMTTASDYRSKVIGYLQQEGLFDNLSFGLVDFGWKGSLQKSLSQLLNSTGMYPNRGTQGFYFALKRRVEALPNDCFSAYFFDIANPLKNNERLLIYSDLYEALVTADHGSTVKFQSQNNVFSPVFRHPTNDEMLNWGIQIYQESIVEFTKRFSSTIKKEECSYNSFIFSAKLLLETFINSPSKEEAIAFGSLSHSPDMTEKILYELAPKLTISLLLYMVFGNIKWHQQLWKPGLIARNNKFLLFLFNLLLKWDRVKFRFNKKTIKLSSYLINNLKLKKLKKYSKTNYL